MLPQEIIRRKRDGLVLSEAEIGDFVKGIAAGAIGEGQMAAFAMAVLLKGMDVAERAALTRAMALSGTVLDWSDAGLDGPVLDKHSTGGVGDKVSLVLAPIVAACGGFVPMLSGRGLGHTGGTLDKLSAIPGYLLQPDIPTLRRVVAKVGCAIVGATADLAPADRALYAVRDVTATVESMDLITASILAKKLAAGLDALIMDVKLGSGAFLPGRDDAEALARSIVEVGRANGLTMTALLTDMNAVLGRAAGNALEVAEAVNLLKNGGGDPRLTEVTITLSAELLTLGGLAGDLANGREIVQRALSTGRAAERFGKMVRELGGPADMMEASERHLPAAPVVLPIEPRDAGRVASIDVRKLGLAIVSLGGGRVRVGDSIDVSVGLADVAGIGEAVEPGGRPLALIHARDRESAERAGEAIHGAFALASPQAPAPVAPPLVAGRIGP